MCKVTITTALILAITLPPLRRLTKISLGKQVECKIVRALKPHLPHNNPPDFSRAAARTTNSCQAPKLHNPIHTSNLQLA